MTGASNLPHPASNKCLSSQPIYPVPPGRQCGCAHIPSTNTAPFSSFSNQKRQAKAVHPKHLQLCQLYWLKSCISCLPTPVTLPKPIKPACHRLSNPFTGSSQSDELRAPSQHRPGTSLLDPMNCGSVAASLSQVELWARSTQLLHIMNNRNWVRVFVEMCLFRFSRFHNG